MMPPNNVPVAQLERETGISNVTPYTWRKQARQQGVPVPGDGKNPEQWSAENRFAVLMETHWVDVRQQLLDGSYQPQAIRKVEIPKSDGGVRTLGIPSVLDRLIQQALHQILSPLFEVTFSDHSYGFRPGRGEAQAVQQARSYMEEGRRWVVDIDLEAFFDRVNHDILMSRVARRVKDRRVLRLVRSYLQAGLMEGGLISARTEGIPQGGPLSPLLSNILLTDLDRELERRGHRFCRYADDCNVYVRSRRAGECQWPTVLSHFRPLTGSGC